MATVRQNIAKGFQWHVKWVRTMLIVSVLFVVGIALYPDKNPQKIAYDLNKRISKNREAIRPAPVPDSTLFSIEERRISREIASSDPIKIEIVQEKKPFDWKGTITWAIGAINGLILVVLNIKNLLIKKATP